MDNPVGGVVLVPVALDQLRNAKKPAAESNHSSPTCDPPPLLYGTPPNSWSLSQMATVSMVLVCVLLVLLWWYGVDIGGSLGLAIGIHALVIVLVDDTIARYVPSWMVRLVLGSFVCATVSMAGLN